MKRLILFRHAKSSWDDAIPRDFDRPLNRRGERAAATMGRHVAALGHHFDHIVASPAVRCVETLERFAEGYGDIGEPNWDRRIYLASCATLLDVVHDIPDTAAFVMMCGHNPGMEDMVLNLVPANAGGARDDVEEKFPTAAYAVLAIDVTSWRDIGWQSATLELFVRPRDLDPSLGPDDS